MATITDDFNRADSTSLGAGWVEVSGDWSIISSRLSSGNAGGTIILRAAGAMASSDHSVQVTIAATAAVSHGVWARGNSNISQGYLWRNDGTSWNLFSVVGGSFSSIGSYAAAAVAGDVAKLEVVGSTIKGYVNGVVRVSVTDTNVATGTSVGIRAESVSALRFDDFAAADVASGVTGDAAFSGAATLSASGLRAAVGSAALAATAALTTSGLRATAGSAALSSAISLTAGGVRATAGDASLTSIASLAADGIRSASATAGLAAAATLAADGTVAAAGDATLTSTAALSASGQRSAAASASLAAAADLAATGLVDAAGQAALDATAALAASGVRQAQADAELAAEVALTAQGQILRSGAAALTSLATLTADGVTGIPPVAGAAALAATGTLAASGHRATVAGVALDAEAALTAAGSTASARGATLTATATLTAAGTTLTTRDDVDVTVGTPYSPWATGQPYTSAWTVQAARTADWKVGAPW
jgi:hypothetical protein